MTAPGLIPSEAISRQAWLRLDRAANDRTDPMRLMTLATVAADGRPGARLMVIRGAETTSSRIWFHTDRRAPKCADVRANPCVCVVAYDPRDGVQLRLSGRAVLHESDRAAESHWQQTTTMLRYLAGVAADMDEPPALPDPRMHAGRADLESALTLRARSSFAVIEVMVETIDWFQATDAGQRRAVLHASTGWRPEVLP